MKNVFKLKSMMLTVLAMLAVSVTSLGLTSCGSDDDDDAAVTSIYGQWLLNEKDLNAQFGEYAPLISAGAYEFQKNGTLITLVRLKADNKWYTFDSTSIDVIEINATSGSINIYYGGMQVASMNYEIKGGKLFVYSDVTYELTPTKGIVSNGYIED